MREYTFSDDFIFLPGYPYTIYNIYNNMTTICIWVQLECIIILFLPLTLIADGKAYGVT